MAVTLPPPSPEILAVAVLHAQHPDLQIGRVDLIGAPGPRTALVRVPNRAALNAWAVALGTRIRSTGRSIFGTEHLHQDPPRLESWSWWRRSWIDTRAEDTPVRLWLIEVSDPDAPYLELARPDHT